MGLLKTVLKYFFLVVFALLMVSLAASLVLVYAAQATFLDSGFYKAELQKTGAYDTAYVLIEGALETRVGPRLAAMENLSGISLQDVFTKAWLKGQTDNLLDNTFSYLKGQSASVNLTLYLAGPKNQLLDSVGQKYGSSAKAVAANQLQEAIPDSIDLVSEFNLDVSPFTGARQGVAMLGSFEFAALIGLLILAVLIFLLTRPSLPSTLRWIGAPLTLAGLFAIGSVEFFKIQAANLYAQFPDPASVQVARQFSDDALALFNQNLNLPAVGLILLGLAMVVGSFLVKRPAKEEKQTKVPETQKGSKANPETKKKPEKGKDDSEVDSDSDEKTD